MKANNQDLMLATQLENKAAIILKSLELLKPYIREQHNHPPAKNRRALLLKHFVELKRWLSHYDIKNLYPIGYADLVDAVDYAIVEFNRRYPGLELLWSINYDHLNINQSLNINSTYQLLHDVIEQNYDNLNENESYSLWHVALARVVSISKQKLYDIFKVKLNDWPTHRTANLLLDKWIRNIARFQSHDIMLCYKKYLIQLKLCNEPNLPKALNLQMTESILYNAMFNIHAKLNGIKIEYFGFRCKDKKLVCHGGGRREIYKEARNIFSAVTPLMENKTNTAYLIYNYSDRTEFLVARTQTQLIVIKIDYQTLNIGLPDDRTRTKVMSCIINSLFIAGFSFTDSTRIVIKEDKATLHVLTEYENDKVHAVPICTEENEYLCSTLKSNNGFLATSTNAPVDN